MAIERLETRRVLAAFIVDTLADTAGGICGVDGIGNSGCSLRSAIIAANALPGPDTITLSPGTYTLSIDNDQPVPDAERGDLNITESVSIIGTVGPGPAPTTIDGGQIDRIFSIAGETVIIDEVILQNGRSPEGPSGGAIDSVATRLEIRRSIIQNNATTAVSPSSDGDGGAIVADGTLIIENSIIRSNRADGFGGAIAFNGDINNGILRIVDSVIEDNTSARQGGAIYSLGGTVEIIDSSILRNEASDAGGGIAAESNVSLDNAIIDNNEAGTRGGGIAMLGGTRFEAIASTISGNRSTSDGGGLWAGNSDYDIVIVGGSIRDNVSGSDGGGLIVIGDLQSQASTSVLLVGVDIMSNQAAASGGGAYIYIVEEFEHVGGNYFGNSAQGAGGGLYLLDIGSVTVDGTSFTSNNSVDGGGAVTVLTDATFRNTLFDSNQVVTTTVADQLRFDLGGGAIAIAQDFSEPPTVRIESSTIINNSAPLGGGIGSANANLVIINSTIEANSTTASIGGGGGVGFAQDALGVNQTQRAQLTITGSLITRNTSLAEAGGIGVADADALITNTTVSRNGAVTGRGGGLGFIGLNNEPVLKLERVTIDNNLAASDGGGVAVVDANFVITNTTISDNSAEGNGGGLAFSTSDNSVSPFVDFSTIASNRTGGFGGNVAASGGVTSFRSSIVADPLGGTVIPARNFVSGGPGQLSSEGFNLVTDTSPSFAEVTDLINVNPLLGPLANNGGSVLTRALLANSPAIDAGADSSLPVDARNRRRPFDGNSDGTAANDIGAFEALSQANDGLEINGVVFVDENNNGLDASDQRLPGITVRLFRDGGNGVFGGDDTLVDSFVSETLSSGNLGGYFFTDLSAGLYFVAQDAASTPPGLLAPAPAPITLALDQFSVIQTIDNFSQTSQRLTVDANDPLAGGTVGAAEAIGGNRGLNLTHLFGSGTLEADVVAGTGLAISSSAGTGGRVLLAYDGPSGSGLEGVDLTGGRDDAGIVLRGSTDVASGVVRIELRDATGQFSVASVALPLGSNSNVFLPFSEFAGATGSGTPFDYASIESIIVSALLSGGQDAFITNIASARRGVVSVNLANQPDTNVPFVNAEADNATVDEDSSATIDVLANDSTNVGTLRIVSTSGASNGTVAIVNNRIVYTPDPDHFGSDSFTYEVTNTPVGVTGNSSSATVSIDVSAVNDPPIASNDRFTTTQPTPLTLAFTALLSNDTAGPSNESQVLSIASVTQPSAGSVLLTATGVVFSPPPSFTGTTSFTYTVRDDGGATDTATVTIDVLPSGASADLGISLSGPATAGAGDTFDYSVTIRGESAMNATLTTARIVLGQGISFQSAGSLESNLRPSLVPTVSSNGNEVTLSLNELLVNEVVTFRVTVLVGSLVSPSAVITTTATVSSQLPDPTPGNNTDTFSTAIASGNRTVLTGLVSCDANGNGSVDAGEAIQGVTVFIDRNGNRLLDAGEQSALTDDSGVYRFAGLDASTGASARVVVQSPPACIPISPEFGVTREALSTGRLSRAITAVDMDRDGDLDLLVVNALSNDVSVLLNNQNSGTFTAGPTIPLAKRPQAISVWQPNPNVAPVVAIAAVGTVADKGSLFVVANGATTELSAGNGPVSVAVNDFNRDGRADFAVASLRSNNIVGRMSGEAGERVLATARSPRAVTTGFVNDDSFLDLIVVATGFDGDDSSEVIVMLGDGRGNFTPLKQTIPGRGSIDVAVGDFDDDERDEIVIANYGGTVAVKDFVGGRLVTTASVETEIGIEAVGARDINRDGRTDLVIANAKAETIELFLNTSDGFVRNKTITGIASPSDLVVASLDSDGIVDIAVANLYGQTRPNFSFPSSATVLGLTVAEREVVLTANQTTTADFQYELPRGDTGNDSETMRMDVDRNGSVTARDALLVINTLSRSFRAEGESTSKPQYVCDVNGDGLTTALDALRVINHISRQRRVSRVAEAEAMAAPSGLGDATEDDTTRRLAASRAANVDEALGSLGQLF